MILGSKEVLPSHLDHKEKVISELVRYFLCATPL